MIFGSGLEFKLGCSGAELYGAKSDIIQYTGIYPR